MASIRKFNDTPRFAYNPLSEKEGLEVKSISWKCEHFLLQTLGGTGGQTYSYALLDCYTSNQILEVHTGQHTKFVPFTSFTFYKPFAVFFTSRAPSKDQAYVNSSTVHNSSPITRVYMSMSSTIADS